MTHVLRLGALGSHLEVRCVGESAGALSAAMRQAWSRCLVADDLGSAAPDASIEVRLDEADRLARRLMTATQEITKALVKSQRGRLLMLHAGAVSHPATGASLVFVAPGGTGKTTLSRRLGRSFGYLTDETVGVDGTGAILPYPKPLSVRRAEQPGLKDEVSPDALELRPAPEAPHVSRVVLLDRRPGVTGTQIEEVDFMDALFALTEQSSSLALLERPLHRLAGFIDAAEPVLRVRYAEAEDIEHDLALLVGGAP